MPRKRSLKGKIMASFMCSQEERDLWDRESQLRGQTFSAMVRELLNEASAEAALLRKMCKSCQAHGRPMCERCVDLIAAEDAVVVHRLLLFHKAVPASQLKEAE